MLYIHDTACISPQQSFGEIDIKKLRESANNLLRAVEPSYANIPAGLLRRMGKAVKIGVGAAVSLLKDRAKPDGILIGTANGGMEDCIKFLNQIIEYDEGILAPGNFVQSTANAIASQLGMMSRNHSYNVTHVHRGLAFENALADAMLLAHEYPLRTYLLGGVDEISAYNYHIDYLDGWFKTEPTTNQDLYHSDTSGSMAGEGAAMFIVNGIAEGAVAMVKAVHCVHSDDPAEVAASLKNFLDKESPGMEPDWIFSGENGDCRELPFYAACESRIPSNTGIARFKHMTGEYATASAVATWLACYALSHQSLPAHMVKRQGGNSQFRNILLYNCHKHRQHGFLLLQG